MKKFVILFILFIFSSSTFAWDKHGHEIVAFTAARLLEKKFNAPYLRNHAFDLSYYANVPDIIWRNDPEPAKHLEPPQHYIDWTKKMESVFGSPENLPLEFKDFKAKMGGDFKLNLGVAPYRIHGLLRRCKELAQNLTRDTQGPLLVCLGLLSHYTGDLSMPLHTTDNYDGQQTDQRGVHSFFEATLVNELYPDLKTDVLNQAMASFDKSELNKMDSEGAVRFIIDESHRRIDELLLLDKTTDRHNLKIAKEKFRKLITDQLVQGALLTARLWSDVISEVHHFDDRHFYFFDGRPEYIIPGKE